MFLLCIDFIKYIAIVTKAIGMGLIVAIISRGVFALFDLSYYFRVSY
jgi:hypothetical protein